MPGLQSALMMLLKLLGKESSIIKENMTTYNLLQWNPHFEVAQSCPVPLKESAAILAGPTGLDFASIIEDESNQGSLFSYMMSLSSTCGMDATSLYYDKTKFTKTGVTTLCLDPKPDRAGVVASFVPNGQPDQHICVVSAHFPHPGSNASAPLVQIKNALASMSCTQTILMADTNIQSELDAQQMSAALGLSATASVLTYKNSCCQDPPGYVFDFDRMIASQGMFTNSNMGDRIYDKFSQNPCWAIVKNNKFHKPLRATLTVSSSVTSGYHAFRVYRGRVV